MSSLQRKNNFKLFFTSTVIVAFLWLNVTLYQSHNRYSALFMGAQNVCAELIRTLVAPHTLNTPQLIISSQLQLDQQITTLNELGVLNTSNISNKKIALFWSEKVSPALIAALNNTSEHEDDVALLLVTRLQSKLNDSYQYAFNKTTKKSNLLSSISIALLLVLLMYLYISSKYHKLKAIFSHSPVAIDSGQPPVATEATTLLHRTLPKLIENPDSLEALKTLLSEIEQAVNASSSAIFLCRSSGDLADLLVCTYIKEQDIHISCAENFPENFTPLNLQVLPIFLATYHGNYKMIVIELPYDSENNAKALLSLKVASNIDLNDSHGRLLRDHTELLASMIHISQFFKHKLRNVQYEERATIARELHDSIAQSLSYLKIQASRLQSMINNDKTLNNNNLTQIDLAVQELRESISIAYRHLRELLTTFRLTMDGNSFATAIEDSIKEFEKRCSIVFELDNRLPDGELSVAEEMQLLHIMREALSNVVRHSHAQYTRITLLGDKNDMISMTIEDDGTGLAPPTERENHHGLIIMQERTRSIGGTLEIDEREEKGTRVNVTFHSIKHTGNR